MNIKLAILLFVMVLTGTLNTIFNGLISSAKEINYYHGFFLSYVMFVGEMFLIIVLNVSLLFNKKKRTNHFSNLQKTAIKDEKGTTPSNFRIGFGAIFDGIGSTLISFALIYLDPSVNLIGRAGIIVIVAIYSYFWLKSRYNLTQYIGLLLVIVGLLLVFVSAILKPEKEENQDIYTTKQKLIALAFLILSWFIQGFQMVYQEKMLMKYEIDLNRYVGIEGVYGIIFTTIILIFTSFINCPKNSGICPEGGKIDNVSSAIVWIFDDGKLAIFTLLFGICICIYNYVGLKVTKEVSSLFRMIMDNVRSITVWIFGLFYGTEEFHKFVFLQILGFIIFILGSLLYQRIICLRPQDKMTEEEKLKSKSSVYRSKL